MPGKEPLFFDTENAIIFENVVDGAYLGCEGSLPSLAQPTVQLNVLSQTALKQNNAPFANMYDHQGECFMPFPYCTEGEGVGIPLFPGSPSNQVYECMPFTPDPWQDTHADKSIGNGQALLCDPQNFTNSSKLFCSKGNKWIYVLMSGQTLSDEEILAEFEKNRDALIEIYEKQLEQMNIAAYEKNSWDYRMLNETEIKNGARWYVDAMLGILKSKNDNGFAHYDSLDENTKRSLAALMGCLPKYAADYDFDTKLWSDYDTNQLEKYNREHLYQLWKSGRYNDILTKHGVLSNYRYDNMYFHTSAADALLYKYAHPGGTEKGFFDLSLFVGGFFVGSLVGKITTVATPWFAKLGFSLPVSNALAAGVGSSVVSIPYNMYPVLNEKGKPSGVDVRWNRVLLAGAIGGGVQGYRNYRERNTTRVGRWMSQEEYDKMVKTGKVQLSSGQAYVANPAKISAYQQQAKPGSIYAEFDVPSNTVFPGGRDDWGIVAGPGSLQDRYNQHKGLSPITEIPDAMNIQKIGVK